MPEVYKYGISPALQFIDTERLEKAATLNLKDGTKRSTTIIDCIKRDMKLGGYYDKGVLSALKVKMTALERFKALVVLFIQVIFKTKPKEMRIERWHEVKEGSFVIVKIADMKAASLAPSLLAPGMEQTVNTFQKGIKPPLIVERKFPLASSDQIEKIRKNLSAYFNDTNTESERNDAYDTAFSIMQTHSFSSSDVKRMFRAFMNDLSESVQAECVIEEEKIIPLLKLLKRKGLSMSEALLDNQDLIKQLNSSLKQQISVVIFEEIAHDVDHEMPISQDDFLAVVKAFHATGISLDIINEKTDKSLIELAWDLGYSEVIEFMLDKVGYGLQSKMLEITLEEIVQSIEEGDPIAEDEFLGVVKGFYNAGAPVNQQEKVTGNTLMHFAVFLGYAKVIEFMWDKKEFDTSVQNHEDQMAQDLVQDSESRVAKLFTEESVLNRITRLYSYEE